MGRPFGRLTGDAFPDVGSRAFEDSAFCGHWEEASLPLTDRLFSFDALPLGKTAPMSCLGAGGRGGGYASLLLLAAGLVSSTAGAQVSQIVFPPSLLVPNYNHVFPGLTESLEAGADLARAWTAPAVWYNPAGLVLSTRTAVNASLQGYQATLLTGTGFNEQGIQISNFRSVPSFVGVVLGEEVINLKNVRFGFAMTNDISWQQGINLSSSSSSGTQALYQVDSSFEQFRAQAAVSWAVNPKFRLGFELSIPYTSISNTGQLTGSLQGTGTTVGSLRTVALSGYNFHILPGASFQWDVLDFMSVGAMVSPPGLRILRGGSLSLSAITNATGTSGPTATQQVNFRDTGATFNYVIPAELSFGVAAHFGPVEVELDAHWYLATGPYNVISSSAPVTTINSAMGAGTGTTVSSLPTDVWGTRGVLDFNLGGHYKVSNLVTLHAGFYSDHSPGNVPDLVYRTISLYGMRGGVSLTTASISGSVGLGYEFGSSNTALFEVTPPGVPPQSGSQQKLTIQTVSLLFALAYVF
jgi:long-subunit fatty acid transport protein